MSVAVAEETAVAISEIEDRLAELGYETEFSSDDDGTLFTVSVGDKELNIHDAVSGDYFRPENVTKADYWFGLMGKDVTERFAEVESVEDFLYEVSEVMSVTFMAR